MGYFMFYVYILLYMICIPGYYLKICNMSPGYVTVRIHSAALGHPPLWGRRKCAEFGRG